jgi:choline dehydrogenase-like flavoprotein
MTLNSEDVLNGHNNGHTNGNNQNSSSALCTVEDFLAQSYDYLVVGGGTAGLCVAARLSENPDVKVGVIEGGANRMDDPNVSTPAMYPALIGREKYDWCFTSVPQVYYIKLRLPSRRYSFNS